MPKSDRDRNRTSYVVPPFTGSLDARVPSENVVLSHYMAELEKWYAASMASDGRIFTSLANTEALGRRAAGIRTFEHLQKKATGEFKELSPEEIKVAGLELTQELSKLHDMIVGLNEPFPSTYPKRVVLVELLAARDFVDARADRGILARWVLPPLLFLSGAFAEGVIGVGAEKAIASLTKILSG